MQTIRKIPKTISSENQCKSKMFFQKMSLFGKSMVSKLFRAHFLLAACLAGAPRNWVGVRLPHLCERFQIRAFQPAEMNPFDFPNKIPNKNFGRKIN